MAIFDIILSVLAVLATGLAVVLGIYLRIKSIRSRKVHQIEIDIAFSKEATFAEYRSSSKKHTQQSISLKFEYEHVHFQIN